MRWVRSTVAAVLFAIYGVGSLGVGLLLFPLLSIFGACRAKRALVRCSWRLFLGVAQWTGMVRVAISAQDRAKLAAARGRVVVANHPTLFDIVVLMVMLPDSTGIAKAAAGRNFFYSAIVKGMFLINDDPERVLVETADLLAAGVNLVVFPEGTRTPVEAPEHPLRRGAAQIALRSGAPVLPVTIVCEPPVLARGQPWHDLSDRTVEWRLKVHEEMQPADFPSGGSVRANAVELSERIARALFQR